MKQAFFLVESFQPQVIAKEVIAENEISQVVEQRVRGLVEKISNVSASNRRGS